MTLITFTIVFYYLERPLKVNLENNLIKNNLLQINFTGIFEFLLVLKDDYLEQSLMTAFCNHFTEEQNTPKHLIRKC